MKKTLTLIFFASLCLNTFAQKTYRVTNLQGGVYNEYTKKWNWGKTESVDLTFLLKSNNIYINDQAETRLTTYEFLGEKTDYDEDGDKYTVNSWRAVDERNRKCLFVMYFYTELNFNLFCIIYSDFGFRYYIQKNALDKFNPTL